MRRGPLVEEFVAAGYEWRVISWVEAEVASLSTYDMDKSPSLLRLLETLDPK